MIQLCPWVFLFMSMEGTLCAHGKYIESAGKPPFEKLFMAIPPQETVGVETSVFNVCLIK